MREIGSRYYSPEQTEAWAFRAPSPDRIASLYADGRTALVAADADDVPVAFTDVEADGHIHFLYCSPEAAGTGVAAQLYEALEQAARERGIARLYAEASEAARGFFVRKGFVVLARRDFGFDGVAMHNYAVEKQLR